MNFRIFFIGPFLMGPFNHKPRPWCLFQWLPNASQGSTLEQLLLSLYLSCQLWWLPRQLCRHPVQTHQANMPQHCRSSPSERKNWEREFISVANKFRLSTVLHAVMHTRLRRKNMGFELGIIVFISPGRCQHPPLGRGICRSQGFLQDSCCLDP